MNEAAGSSVPGVTIEIDDIQSGALHARPSPYVGRFFLLRVQDSNAGRAFLRRLLPATEGGLPSVNPDQDAWVTMGLTYQGLRALGVPPESLDSFPPAFQEGMAARADLLGEVGESDPAHWEPPFGTPEVHITLAALAPKATRLEKALDRERAALKETPGVAVIWAPLTLSPDHDDEALGTGPHRNNAFGYAEDDARGLKCPAGAHVRRVNPRDADVLGATRLHRIICRGTSYGPPLPAGVLEDDGADRGLVGGASAPTWNGSSNPSGSTTALHRVLGRKGPGGWGITTERAP